MERVIVTRPPLGYLKFKTLDYLDKSDRHWRTHLKTLYGDVCFLTGKKPSSKPADGLVVHHLFGRHHYPQYKLDFLNGIPLLNSLHKRYHSTFGSKGESVNPRSFLRFIELLRSEAKDSLLIERLLIVEDWIELLTTEMENGY